MHHVFEVEHISNVNSDTVLHYLIPEVDIAATKPEVIISRRVTGQVFQKFLRLFTFSTTACSMPLTSFKF